MSTYNANMDTNTSYDCLFDTCKAVLPSLRSLLLHMHLLHGCEKNACLCCRVGNCGKIYSTTDSYRKHVEREHCFEFNSTNVAQQPAAVASTSAESVHCHSEETAETEADESNFGHMLQLITRNITFFALHMREAHSLPKSTCTSIMNGLAGFFTTFLTIFSQFILSRMEERGIDVSVDQSLHHVLHDQSMFDGIWENVSSDAKIKRYCKENLALVEPETVILGVNEVTGKEESYEYISVSETLKQYLMHEDVFDSIHRKPCKAADVLYDYTDGTAFKQHRFFSTHSNALRLHFYVDEVELCNPLGSAKKKHAITAVYYQLGNLEQKHLSTLKSIHVACIVKYVYVKKYGLHKTFEKLISDINLLELEGIEVVSNGHRCTYFASIATVSADNLASHEIGGFRKCFSSGHICRFCLACYETRKHFCSESDEGYPKLRTSFEHEKHTQSVMADSSLAVAYGVNSQAALHSLSSFDTVTSLPPDCMHDVLEGVVPTILKVCLSGLIALQIITISVFNERLQKFRFGQNDSKNAPCVLAASFPKVGISGSASQKWCLLRNLSFIIGDLVPVDNKYWDLYLLCRQITEIIFAPALTVSQILHLDLLIRYHHTCLLELAPEEFTPKFHFVTHYPRLMSVYGPLRHVWCMRFESYHQYLKTVAEHTGNFKNICHTLAERNQLRKCMEQSGDHCLETNDILSCQNKTTISSLPKSLQGQISKYFGCSVRSSVISVKSAVLSGVKYAVKDCFVLDVTDSDVPMFFIISYILCYDGIWAVAGCMAVPSEFLSHYHAYVILRDPDWIVVRPGLEMSYHAVDTYRISLTAAEHELVALRHTLPS